MSGHSQPIKNPKRHLCTEVHESDSQNTSLQVLAQFIRSGPTTTPLRQRPCALICFIQINQRQSCAWHTVDTPQLNTKTWPQKVFKRTKTNSMVWHSKPLVSRHSSPTDLTNNLSGFCWCYITIPPDPKFFIPIKFQPLFGTQIKSLLWQDFLDHSRPQNLSFLWRPVMLSAALSNRTFQDKGNVL